MQVQNGTWTVSALQHEHLATPTLVNTADWLPWHWPTCQGQTQGKADKLTASFTFSFLFFVFISLLATWWWLRMGVSPTHSSRQFLSFFSKGQCHDLSKPVSKCYIRDTAAIFTPTCPSSKVIIWDETVETNRPGYLQRKKALNFKTVCGLGIAVPLWTKFPFSPFSPPLLEFSPKKELKRHGASSCGLQTCSCYSGFQFIPGCHHSLEMRD